MALKPTINNVTSRGQQTANILNAIRNEASRGYQESIPSAKNTYDSRQQVMNAILEGGYRNEFLEALYNRIGKVILMNQTFNQPWGVFKKGILEYGEVIEQIFVDIAKPMIYNPARAEKELYKREIPDVKTMFYVINFKNFYKQTVQEYSLKQAFLTETGLYDLVASIITAMVNAAIADEFMAMKYVLGRAILDGKLKPVTISTVVRDNYEDIVSTIKGVSNDWTFPTSEYNSLGITRQVKKDDQYLISTSRFDSVISVSVLAKAFNMSEAEFNGKDILVDGFGKFDMKRLGELLAEDPNYRPFTDAELEALQAIPAVLIDKDFFVMFDNLYLMNQKFNEEGLYFNHWLHRWSTVGTCWGANSVVFIEEEAKVNSVTVSPKAVTIPSGTNVKLNATVETTGFASKEVEWTTNVEGVSVFSDGNVVIPDTIEDGTVITVKATSVYDTTKYDTATITVGTGGSGVTITATPASVEFDDIAKGQTYTETVTLSGGNKYFVDGVTLDITGGGGSVADVVTATISGSTLTITITRGATDEYDGVTATGAVNIIGIDTTSNESGEVAVELTARFQN